MNTTLIDRELGRRREARAPTKGLRIAAGVSTGVFAALMAASGVLYVVEPRALMDALAHLGYPAYFVELLGIAKLSGAFALVAPVPPTLREWAYAGFTFDLLFAIASHALRGGTTDVFPPLVALGLVSASYALRRRSRLGCA